MKKHIYYYIKKINRINCKLISIKNAKLFLKSSRVNNSFKQKIMFLLNDKNNKINITNIRKFCFLTGRLKSLAYKSKFNRITFRELVSNCEISGIYKK